MPYHLFKCRVGEVGLATRPTTAAPQIADIHHRQPVILGDEAMETWLDPEWDREGSIEMARKGCELAYDPRRVPTVLGTIGSAGAVWNHQGVQK